MRPRPTPNRVPEPMWLHCPHREWREETPCPPSADVPASAVGHPLPGDEAGFECAIGGHPCDLRPALACCPRYVSPLDQEDDGEGWLFCPDCAEAGDSVRLLRRREGWAQGDYEDVYACPRCDFAGRAADALSTLVPNDAPSAPARVLAVPHHASHHAPAEAVEAAS